MIEGELYEHVARVSESMARTERTTRREKPDGNVRCVKSMDANYRFVISIQPPPFALSRPEIGLKSLVVHGAANNGLLSSDQISRQEWSAWNKMHPDSSSHLRIVIMIRKI